MFVFLFVGLVFVGAEYDDLAFANDNDLQKIVIVTSEDSSVDEDMPYEKFGKEDLLASGWSHSTSDDVKTVKQALSYVKFPLDALQDNTKKIENVDVAKLRLFVQTEWGNVDEYFVTVYTCFDSSWIEEDITWDNRTCKEYEESYSSFVKITKGDTRDIYDWDVTESVKDALKKNLQNITFIVSTVPYDGLRVDLPNYTNDTTMIPGLVWIWSHEMNDTKSNGIPTLDIQYTIDQEILTLYEIIAIGAVATIVTAVILTWYLKFRKRTKYFTPLD